MNDPAVFLALIAIVAGVVAAATTSSTFAQKKVVEVLERVVAKQDEEKKLLGQDNREQAITIGKMGTSVDRLTDQVAQSARLLEDLVYGREAANKPRRS